MGRLTRDGTSGAFGRRAAVTHRPSRRARRLQHSAHPPSPLIAGTDGRQHAPPPSPSGAGGIVPLTATTRKRAAAATLTAAAATMKADASTTKKPPPIPGDNVPDGA